MAGQNVQPTLLLILDGFGVAPAGPGNAVSLAKTPVLDRLFATCPHTELACSGRAVGLPDGFMGNSEVGHMNIGAGRIVYQDMTRIDIAIEDGSFAKNAALLELIAQAKAGSGRLHLMGLLSDGGVHSHQNHIRALLELAKANGLCEVFVHVFWMAATLRLPAAWAMFRRWNASWPRLALVASPPSRVAITPWTATSTLSVTNRRTSLWHVERAGRCVAPRKPSPQPMPPGKPTSS